MDTQPGAPCRIPSIFLCSTFKSLHDGGCPNPDNASQDREERGLRQRGALRNTLMEKSLD